MSYLFAFFGVVAFLAALKNLKDTDRLLSEIEERQANMADELDEPAKEIEVMEEAEREQFELAFRPSMCSQIGHCECGRIFWDGHNTGYDWEEGQQAELEANQKATRVEYAIEYVDIFGGQYVSSCDCWLDKAARIVCWLRENQRYVSEWYKLEKRRLQCLANDTPEIME